MLDDEHNYRSFILYVGMQEVARQVSLSNRDLGYLLLKLFKGYFEENEKVWLKLVQKARVSFMFS